MRNITESDSSNNTVSKSMKTPIIREARFTVNGSSNRSKKSRKNLDNKIRQKLCESAKKRMRTFRENIVYKAIEKLHKIGQKRTVICKKLGDEAKEKLCEAAKKSS